MKNEIKIEMKNEIKIKIKNEIKKGIEIIFQFLFPYLFFRVHCKFLLQF